jgi:hypothetical protein
MDCETWLSPINSSSLSLRFEACSDSAPLVPSLTRRGKVSIQGIVSRVLMLASNPSRYNYPRFSLYGIHVVRILWQVKKMFGQFS